MKFYIVDCFAQARYQGNQLAVFVPDRPVSAREMQQIANEMGFSETSFILSGKQLDGGYDVRIFTPAVEVPFAGHPTLGTAYVIQQCFESGTAQEIRLNLKAGQIPVYASKNGLTMSQNQPKFGITIEKSIVAPAISISAADIRDDYPVQQVSTGLEAVIVPLKTIEALERCHVNYDELDAFHHNYCNCNVLAFVPHGGGLRVRVFMEDPGFLEDPATGSANGDLAAYLLRYHFFGRSEISYTVSQGSEMGRPSTLYIDARLSDGTYTIQVGGQAHIIAAGEWAS